MLIGKDPQTLPTPNSVPYHFVLALLASSTKRVASGTPLQNSRPQMGVSVQTQWSVCGALPSLVRENSRVYTETRLTISLYAYMI